MKIIQEQLQEAQNVLNKFLEDDKNIEKIESAAQIMAAAVHQNHKILSCGNGGSMCDAVHFAEELTGRYRTDRPALPAIAIADAAHISCVANDYGYAHIFSRYIQALGNAGDVLLAISTSGNSENILQAAQAALHKNMHVVALTGNGGGKLSELAHTHICVPHTGYADRIQEIHIKIIHCLILRIEQLTAQKT
jgi:D-sedoheptulose 7-phosphate isomerase